ncbi:MAG TPA: D-alanyl-D-alanine carboxypeptidase family protein [Stellaceae bacterium]|nr:D-alanyl-D-alanine carboxypeptidase family protein [Stellaceae bacterium]
MNIKPRISGILLAMLLAASLVAVPAAARPAAKAGASAAIPPATSPAAPTGASTTGASTTGASTIGIDTQATHAIIIEADTGTVLLEKAADQPFPPASLNKMMTAYVVFDLLKKGAAKLTDELPVSEAAWRLGGSKMFVPLGGKVSIDDLVHGMIIQSGNDACLVLAEGLAGSEQAFVDLMNKTAKEIGLEHSHFANVTGLPDPNGWVTARDLATLARRTIKDFPQYYPIYGQKEFTFNNIKQGNRNPLLYDEDGADGLKTGHTEEAGYSVTGSIKRGDRRIIIVLGGLPTMRARAEESRRLVDWAFREFDDYRLFTAGETVDDAPVWLGAAPRVPLSVDRNLVVTLARPARAGMKVTLHYDSPIPAPIAKGQPVGTVEVTAPGLTPIEMPLVAAAAVGRMDPIGRIATLAGYLVWGRRH